MSGNAFADSDNVHVGGIIIGTYQAANVSQVGGNRVSDETNGQLELGGSIRTGPGTLDFELRGGTTPRNHGVTTFYASNATVGETLDTDGNGRVALTQAFYELPIGRGRLRAGLLDASGRLDGGEVAADEYTEFMADAFVHNPTIAFPSFVLGIGYQGRISQHLGYALFLSSDSGLEDNQHTYHDAFDVGGRRGAYRKGAFAASELTLSTADYVLKGGVWMDTGSVARLDAHGTARRQGAYFVGEAKLGGARLQLRAGVADAAGQATSSFLSLALQQPVRIGNRAATLGLAVARTGASAWPSSSNPALQAEAYCRIHLAGSFYITPDIQYFANPGSDTTPRTAVIVGARVGLEF